MTGVAPLAVAKNCNAIPYLADYRLPIADCRLPIERIH